jgi:hypothetical protein
MSGALFLCHRQNGLDHACIGALAKALMLDAKTDALLGRASLASVVHRLSEPASRSCKLKGLQSSTREVN